jgi:serine/threonine protein phosphatase 1
MRTFVLGDIHGACRALRQVLDRAQVDYDNDHLIALGDVCDGWPETSACIDELQKFTHLTYLLGNHDFWTLEWMQTGAADPMWLAQGGEATRQSYTEGVPDSHRKFLEKALPYYIEGNKLFVHAGFEPEQPIHLQSISVFAWNRSLARLALQQRNSLTASRLTSYDEVYLGHTVVGTQPVFSHGVWLLDTGAGWSGVLTLMDINTKEIFQSDPVPELYPGVSGRSKHL